jgi:glycosyltransferase involved in cell wall biosynthesis
MRVCHVTILHPRGDQRILFKECRSLAEAGHDVHLIAPPADRPVECPGVTIHTGPRLKSKLRLLGCTWKVFRVARREVQADVYHFHDYWLIPFGLLVAWFTKAAVVMDVHEEYGRASARALQSRKWVPRLVQRCIEKLVNGFEAFGAKRFDHVITVVDSITERFLKVTPHVTEVRNYVKPEVLPDAPPTREDYLARRPILIHQGSFSMLRGADLALRTVRRLKDWNVDCEFWAVDRFLGDEAARRQFLDRIQDLDIADRVQVKPPVSYDELGKYLVQSRIGLSLRIMPEGFNAPTILSNIPTKLFEYMGFGLPIVANDVNFHSVFIQESNSGLLTEYEEESVAKAVAALLQDPDRAYQLGLQGFRTYREKYTWDSQETKLVDVYRRIAEARAAATGGGR